MMGELGHPLHQTAIAKIEAGTRTSTSIGEANALAAITQVPVGRLFDGDASGSESRANVEWAAFRKASSAVRVAQLSLEPVIDEYLNRRQQLFFAADRCVDLLEEGHLDGALEVQVRDAVQEVYTSTFDGGLVEEVRRRVESAENVMHRERSGGIGEYVETIEVLPSEEPLTVPAEQARLGARPQA